MPNQIDELDEELRELLRRKADAIGPPDGLERTMRRSTRRLARNAVVALLTLGLLGSGAVAGVRSLGGATGTKPADTSPSPSPMPQASGSSGVRSAVSTEGVTWFHPTPEMPLGLAGADGTLWVASGGNIAFPAPASDPGAEAGVASLARFDVDTGKITTVEVGQAGDVGVAAAFGDAWVLRRSGEVIRIDGVSLRKEASIRVPNPSEAAADGSLWVVSLGGTLTRIDPRTNAIVATIDTGVPATRGIENNGDLVPPNNGVPATGVSVGDGSVWVRGGGRVVRVDPETNAVQTTIDLGGSVDGLAVGPSGVWASVCGPGGPPCTWQLVRIDPATNAVASRRVLGRWESSAMPGVKGSIGRAGITVDSGSVWVSLAVNYNQYARGKILRIDPATGEIAATLVVPGSGGTTVGVTEQANTSDIFGPALIEGGAVWVINIESGEVVRIDLPGF
ncbi:MAG TPA: hypothetical protein VGL18_09455 [Actinomycetota bacterium]